MRFVHAVLSPDELKAEVEKAGFDEVELLAIEGLSYMMKDFDSNGRSDEHRKFLLEIVRRVEAEESLIGASPHMMCVGRR